MANFLNKLGDMAKTAADKTGDMIEIGKLNAKISTEEAAIAKQKEQIGNFYWEQFLSGQEQPTPVTEWCQAIRASQEAIDALQAEISTLKGEPPMNTASAAPCAACGTVNPPGTKFCGNCGGKLL